MCTIVQGASPPGRGCKPPSRSSVASVVEELPRTNKYRPDVETILVVIGIPYCSRDRNYTVLTFEGSTWIIGMYNRCLLLVQTNTYTPTAAYSLTLLNTLSPAPPSRALFICQLPAVEKHLVWLFPLPTISRPPTHSLRLLSLSTLVRAAHTHTPHSYLSQSHQ